MKRIMVALGCAAMMLVRDARRRHSVSALTRYSESERVAKARQITERNHAKSPNEIASNHRM